MLSSNHPFWTQTQTQLSLSLLTDADATGAPQNKESITIRLGHKYLSCDNDDATEPCEPGVDALERAPDAEEATDITNRVCGRLSSVFIDVGGCIFLQDWCMTDLRLVPSSLMINGLGSIEL